MTAPAVLLALAAVLNGQLDSLQTLVIQETVDRYAAVGTRVQKIDTFATTAEVIDGVERYSGTTHNGREVNGDEIAGTWSFGELATLLRTTRDALSMPGLEGSADHIGFHIPASRCRWFVRIDSRVYWLDISGEVSSSMIRWTSSELPAATGVSHIVWTVAFRPMKVGGEIYVLPEVSEYHVFHRGNRAEWNMTRYAALGRYGAATSIEYGQ